MKRILSVLAVFLVLFLAAGTAMADPLVGSTDWNGWNKVKCTERRFPSLLFSAFLFSCRFHNLWPFYQTFFAKSSDNQVTRPYFYQ